MLFRCLLILYFLINLLKVCLTLSGFKLFAVVMHTVEESSLAGIELKLFEPTIAHPKRPDTFVAFLCVLPTDKQIIDLIKLIINNNY